MLQDCRSLLHKGAYGLTVVYVPRKGLEHTCKELFSDDDTLDLEVSVHDTEREDMLIVAELVGEVDNACVVEHVVEAAR
jgi:hypothetical protein